MFIEVIGKLLHVTFCELFLKFSLYLRREINYRKIVDSILNFDHEVDVQVS
jgi:hypothetical protein